ncbi:MAG: hypothetical protein COA82_08125 [Alkaliphilus sp.]|nr:DUF134 domain-containing protein [bacterium AH-315-L21]PHS33848.1 MAG: hypothetical protein COA82_08125 [Alkaliphilus sp.]
MPRPMKWRRIAFIPENKYFVPQGIKKDKLKEVQLKMEELEAMRLKDIEGLSQAECATLMAVSRQTFQLIIDEARRKVAIALTSGMAINITGGNYTYNICKYKCESCAHEFISAYEAENNQCPVCKEENLTCQEIDRFCKKACRKKWCRKNE